MNFAILIYFVRNSMMYIFLRIGNQRFKPIEAAALISLVTVFL